MKGACLLRIELVQMGDDAVCGRQKLLVARARGQGAELHLPALAPVSNTAVRPLHYIRQHICIPCLQACSTCACPPPKIPAARLFALIKADLQHIFASQPQNVRSIRRPPSVFKASQHDCTPSTPDASSAATCSQPHVSGGSYWPLSHSIRSSSVMQMSMKGCGGPE